MIFLGTRYLLHLLWGLTIVYFTVDFSCYIFTVVTLKINYQWFLFLPLLSLKWSQHKLTRCGSRWHRSWHPCSHQQQRIGSHMLGEHQHKLELGHKRELGHKLGQVHRLGRACTLGQGRTEEQQQRQPKEQTKQQSTEIKKYINSNHWKKRSLKCLNVCNRIGVLELNTTTSVPKSVLSNDVDKDLPQASILSSPNLVSQKKDWLSRVIQFIFIWYWQQLGITIQCNLTF